MNLRTTGQFYGLTNQRLTIGQLTLTDTEYTHSYVDWHSHENAYFTFILQGSLIEQNRHQTYWCAPGSLLFHYWQETHCNRKPEGYTRGFHVELNPRWFDQYDLNLSGLQGSFQLQDPRAKTVMYKLLKETKLYDGQTAMAIEAMLLNLFGELTAPQPKLYRQKPTWVLQLTELLRDAPEEDWTLDSLARQLAIHPVHLCRQFPRYFHCHLGEYRRLIRLQKALPLLLTQSGGLTQIALTCGFADQSHFIRAFRGAYGLTPSHYRKLVLR
jgi:AraC family transcriptional regulator